jgi:HlyD family secretion protein
MILSGPADGGYDAVVHGVHDGAADEQEPSLRGIVTIGLLAILTCFGGFGAWSLLAKLDSAALATGVVVADSHRKTVQHLEGGILRELMVREGDVVRAGQLLALLDTTQAESQLGQLAGQQVTLLARIARLNAEQREQRTFTILPDLADRRGEPIVAEALEAQRRLFETRWRAYDSSVGIVGKRIQQYREQITAARAQLGAVEKRLALVHEDLRNATFLFERGYEKRTRLLELQRNVEELNGQASQQRGVIAQAEQSIAGSELEIVNLNDSRHAEVARDLEEARALETDLGERMRAARDVLNRREITAPQDGTVTDIRLVTPGGVIGPGQPLMDIVPLDDPLIVEARVRPEDIEVVHLGLSAQVQLTAFNRSALPPLEGAVVYVSADMLTDPRDDTKYFLARIEPSAAALARLPGLAITPGMPADVMIVTGERRAFQYFVDPLRRHMWRAFRED